MDEKFDTVLLSLAQQHEGGVPQLMDTFFSFLMRKTDFFVGGAPGAAKDMVTNSFAKYERLAKDEQKKKQKAEEERMKKYKEQQAAQKEKEAQESKSRIYEITEEEEKKDEEEKQKQNEKKSEPKTETASTTSAPMDVDKKEKDEEDDGKLAPNKGNGSQTDKYSWIQTLPELEVRIRVPKGTRAKDITCDLKRKKLKIGIKGKPPIIDEELHREIKPDDSSWIVEDNQTIVLLLAKANNMEWWSRVVPSEPEISTRKVQPETSKLEDLDGETRGVVEKMMFDQRQKQMGFPSSDDMQKQDMLKKFMAQHPEMDFSNAKIS